MYYIRFKPLFIFKFSNRRDLISNLSSKSRLSGNIFDKLICLSKVNSIIRKKQLRISFSIIKSLKLNQISKNYYSEYFKYLIIETILNKQRIQNKISDITNNIFSVINS